MAAWDGSVSVGRHAGVNNVHTGLDGLQVRHGRHAGGKMAVKVNGRFHVCLERLDKFVGIIGREQAGHVFHADTVGAHCLQGLGLINVIVDVVDIAAHARLCHGVTDAPLKMLARGLDGRHHGFEIPVVVQSIEGPEYVHAVCRRPFHERLGNVIGIIPVAHKVLTAKQHGKRRFLEIPLQRPDPLPWIFIQKAVHGIEGRAAPGFNGPEADLVHHFRNGNHILGSPPGGEQGLVSVTQGQIFNLDGVFRFWPVLAVVHLCHFNLGMVTHLGCLLFQI